MKEDSKKFNLSSMVNIIKASLIGVIISILLVLGFAFVLKFVDMGSGTISIIDQIIKIISIFVALTMLNKSNGDHLLIRGLLIGIMYSILTFVVFSALNGGFNINMAIFSDILFSTLVGGASAMIINLFKRG